MPTREECQERWSRGYIEGYRQIRSAIPEVPVVPTPPSDVVDLLTYYYKEGRRQGHQKGIHDAGALGKP